MSDQNLSSGGELLAEIYDRTPLEWQEQNLGSLATTITKGTTPTTAGYGYVSEGVNFVKVENLQNNQINLDSITQFISNDAHDYFKRSQFLENDVLFSIAGTIGKTALVTTKDLPANTNQAIAIIRGVDGCFIHRFLNFQFMSLAQKIAKEKARGGAMNNVSLGDLKSLTVKVPPLAEQKVIAEKLDTLLAQVETTKARLERIPDIIKRFRQSVLAAAVSGKLTEEWRGSESLDTWNSIKLNEIIERIEAGKNLKCIETPPQPDEFGIIKISAVTWGSYDEEQSKTLPDSSLFLEERRINKGDFLISRANTIELLGSPVIVHETTKNLMLSDKVLRLVMLDEDKPWVSIFLKSQAGRREIETRSTGNQMSMRNIGQKALLDIDIPKAPDKEQLEIVRRVEELFAFADSIEQKTDAALERVNNLTQSILAKAFRGELTADWRAANPELINGDNSAEALLAKIQAEREALKPVKKARKKKAKA